VEKYLRSEGERGWLIEKCNLKPLIIRDLYLLLRLSTIVKNQEVSISDLPHIFAEDQGKQ
jgi:hypothetical protein